MGYQEITRVRRVLSTEDRKRALELLRKMPVRLARLREGRAVWLAEVWLELENPSEKVAAREVGLTLEEMVTKAANRAGSAMHRRDFEDARLAKKLAEGLPDE